MWPFLSRFFGPARSLEPGKDDLEASGPVEKSAPSDTARDAQAPQEKELAALKKRLGPLTSEAYEKLNDRDRTRLRELEIAKLEQEHTLWTVGEKSSKLSPEKIEKLRNFDDTIQPHTDEGADAYFIGDAYTPINPVFAEEWRIPNPRPYLRYVKQLATTWTHLEYLGHWMENRQRVKDRASRTRVCVVDYADGKAHPSDIFDSCSSLKTALETETSPEKPRQARLIICEDLSRNLVETLGDFFDVDPLFFLSHIMDYLFHNTRDRWVELPNLDVDMRRMPHFTIGYLRARYFENEEAFEKADEQHGNFNVLRRLDSDRSRTRFMQGLLDLPNASVALSRTKTSLWVKPRESADEPVTAILLVDPTVRASHSHALWGGYRPFENTPSMASMKNTDTKQTPAPGRQTLFDDVIYWSSRLTAEDIAQVQKEPRSIAMSMYKLVIADWMTVLKYMTTMLGKIEWEFEKPHWGEAPNDINKLLFKLSPWRRNVGYYEAMIEEAIARLFPPEVRAPLHGSSTNDAIALPFFMRPQTEKGTFSLWTDFQNVKRQMFEIQSRIQNIEGIATNAINIEEARRAVKQNKNLARLTFLATIFIPLNFTSSFLSISPHFGKDYGDSIWLFFAIGVSLTIAALLVVDLSHPGRNGVIMKWWRGMHSPPKKNVSAPVQKNGRPGLARADTFDWDDMGFRQKTTRRMTSMWGKSG